MAKTKAKSESNTPDTLLIEHKSQVATVTLNRPAKRNSLDPELMSGIIRAFSALSEDERVRVIILTWAGGHFCSGLYLNYLNDISEFGVKENLRDSENFKNVLMSIFRCPRPVIAKVRGYALAGGCGIASACDLIIADTSATFGYTEVKFGFVPALVSPLLVRRVGESRARDLLLTARFVDAHEAKEMGLVNHVTQPDQLDDKVAEFADLLCKNTPSSLRSTKEMFEQISDLPLEAALDFAKELNAATRQTPEFKKGLAEILKKL